MYYFVYSQSLSANKVDFIDEWRKIGSTIQEKFVNPVSDKAEDEKKSRIITKTAMGVNFNSHNSLPGNLSTIPNEMSFI